MISTEALAQLEQYHWPGNVRELENIIQRAVVVAKGDVILPQDLAAEVRGKSAAASASAAPVSLRHATATPAPPKAAGDEDMAALARRLFDWARQDKRNKIIPAVERQLIIEALNETQGNQVQAAKLLGITRATLRKRIEKFSIRRELSIS